MAGLGLLGSVVFWARRWSNHRLRQRLRRLQLEQRTWSAHGFVEQVATRQLHMTMPQANEVKIVQQ